MSDKTPTSILEADMTDPDDAFMVSQRMYETYSITSTETLQSFANMAWQLCIEPERMSELRERQVRDLMALANVGATFLMGQRTAKAVAGNSQCTSS